LAASWVRTDVPAAAWRVARLPCMIVSWTAVATRSWCRPARDASRGAPRRAVPDLRGAGRRAPLAARYRSLVLAPGRP